MSPSRVCLTFDFDALSVWFGYERVTPAMLQRGEYGARVGVPRLLERLGALALPATFFIPGHTIESFPAQCEAILAAGHEVAHHSYAHVDPSRQTPDEERADMERALAALDRLGVRPSGYRSPSADMSPATLALLEEHGFLYDSSLMADDFAPTARGSATASAASSRCGAGATRACGSCRCASSSTTGRTSSSPSGRPIGPGSRRRARCSRSGPRSSTGWTTTSTAACSPSACTRRSSARGHRMAMLERFVAHCAAAGGRFARMGDVAKELGSASDVEG